MASIGSTAVVDQIAITQVDIAAAIANVTAVSAGTEYSYTLPANCCGFELRPRKACRARLAFVATETSSNYYSSGYGGYFKFEGKIGPVTIYFQSDLANNVFEILTKATI